MKRYFLKLGFFLLMVFFVHCVNTVHQSRFLRGIMLHDRIHVAGYDLYVPFGTSLDHWNNVLGIGIGDYAFGTFIDVYKNRFYWVSMKNNLSEVYLTPDICLSGGYRIAMIHGSNKRNIFLEDQNALYIPFLAFYTKLACNQYEKNPFFVELYGTPFNAKLHGSLVVYF